MNEQNYWTKLHRRRLSRRRLLAGISLGTAGLASLALVGCSSDSKEGGSSGIQSSPVTATGTSVPKKGGIWRQSTSPAPASLDPFPGTSATNKIPPGYVYSRLFKMQRGPGVSSDSLKPEGDTVESWEVTPDGLTWTLKLRGNVKFHPPLDRLMTAEDVVFSMDRFTGKVPGFAGSGNIANLTTFIDSWKATDARTVVFTLKRPFAALPAVLSDVQNLLIFPRETGQAFDPTKTMVGSGPWIFQEYKPASFLKFRRNPAWHFGPDVPYLDGIEMYVITDPATQLNQFLGGSLDVIGGSSGQLPQVTSAIKDVQVVIEEGSNSYGHLVFSLDDAGAPYLDPQVRQAVSMAIDRDALIEATYEVTTVQAMGYKVSPRWPGFVPSGFGEYWVNPKEDPKLSPYFKYDPEGAKRLLAQAGHANGFSSVPFHWPAQYPGDFRSQAELILQMLGKIGIKLDAAVEDYGSVFIRGAFVGKFDGMAQIANQVYFDPVIYLLNLYTPGSPINRGQVNDPEVTKKVGDIMGEQDANRRKQMIRDFQTYIVDKMYYVPTVFGALKITFYQPNVKGALQYWNNVEGTYGAGAGQLPYIWKDA